MREIGVYLTDTLPTTPANKSIKIRYRKESYTVRCAVNELKLLVFVLFNHGF